MNNLESTLINNTLEKVKEIISSTFQNKSFFNEYIKTLTFHVVKGNDVYITVKNNFAKQIINNDYLIDFTKKFNEILQSSYNIILLTEDEKKINNLEAFTKSSIEVNGLFEMINQNYTFENLFVDDFNQTAVSAGKSLTNNNFLNPLFICGGVGLGKTHLLHAIGNDFHNKFPHKNVKYISADDFSREIYQALTNEVDKLEIERLKEKYESFDLLLIDDVQMLANRDKINGILFGIFNNNISKGKYIVWSCDKNPDTLNGFEDRMKSRFHSGLFVNINKPNVETIKKIIEFKFSAFSPNYFLNPDVINFLANRNKGDIRMLEGALHRISFFITNNNHTDGIINLEIINKILGQNYSLEIKKYGFDVDPDLIISQVCLAYGVKDDAIKSKSRMKYLIAPRNICMYILRKKFDMPFAQIGVYFSGRSHSTIIDSIKKIEKLVSKDTDLNNFIENIYKKI